MAKQHAGTAVISEGH